MKVKVLVATLLASFTLVAYGNSDNGSNVEEANSLGKPATTGYSGAGSPNESQPKEAEANEASSDEVVEKMSGEDAEEELPGAERVLSAAAMTYAASLLVSILYMVRFLFLVLSAFGRRSQRR